jgi:chorismate mutase
MDEPTDQQTDQPTANGDKTLDHWRGQIDALDAELLRLLNQRAAIACEIASIKVASGLPAFDGAREKQVLAHVREENTGPLDQQSVVAIFHSIIRETRRLGTERMEVASEIPNPELAEGEGSPQASGAAEHQHLNSVKRKSFQ